MSSIQDIVSLLHDLSPQDLDEVHGFVETVRRRARAATSNWQFDFVENFKEASVTASRDPAGMEIKVDTAVCAGVARAAVWEHPPVSGSAIIGYLVPVPTGFRKIKLKFSIGIRDGSELQTDRYVAFRVLVNGWKLWSTTKNSRVWEQHEIDMPQLSSDVARIEFVTDGMGDNRWNWAVWGEPRLVGE